MPIGLLALMLAPRVIPPLANSGNSRLDLTGMLLVAAGSVAVVLPLVEGREQGWPLWSWVCLAAALPLLAAFAYQQRRLAARGGAPLVAPALLANGRFVTGLLTTLAFYVGNASLYFVLALYLQQGLALDALTSGVVFTSLAVGFFATSMAGARSHAASEASRPSRSVRWCLLQGTHCSSSTWPAGRGIRTSWRGWCRCCCCRARGSAW